MPHLIISTNTSVDDVPSSESISNPNQGSTESYAFFQDPTSFPDPTNPTQYIQSYASSGALSIDSINSEGIASLSDVSLNGFDVGSGGTIQGELMMACFCEGAADVILLLQDETE